MRRSHANLAALMAVAALGAAQIPVSQSAATQARTEATSTRTSGVERSTPAAQQVSVSEQAAFLNWGHRRATDKSGYPNGPGWSNRQVQRMARKKRNQARHRKACRG